MADWHHGGWSGSIDVWAKRLLAEQIRENESLRRWRRPPLNRALRRFLSVGTFGRFVLGYAALDVVTLLLEGVTGALAPDRLPAWTFPPTGASPVPPLPDVKAILLNVASYLIGAQVGALGIISLALALVTLIAQRDDASTEVQIYYYEALAFELVASCVALIAVLCVQLVWPAQFLLHLAGYGTASQAFKLILLCLHLAWLCVNLGGLAQFVVTTFGFVQQSRREDLRKRYTTNVVHPRAMLPRLRQQIYGAIDGTIAAMLGADGSGGLAFGADYGNPASVEITSEFARPMALGDVRLVWAAYVVRRWHARSVVQGGRPSRDTDPLFRGPTLWFTPMIARPLRGRTAWCMRRGGVPLLPIERLILRSAFRFGRPREEEVLPGPEEILEELADRANAQVDRLSKVSFDAVWGEMVRYHRFLLDANGSRTVAGSSHSFAEIAGYDWTPPHKVWTGTYNRLFERAIDRLPDDDRFLRTMAYAPLRLLPGPDGLQLSPAVAAAILDLGSMLVHRLEAWVSKRSTEGVAEPGTEPRSFVAGSDARSYAAVLPELVGAWESTLDLVTSALRNRSAGQASEEERWATITATWPAVWHHLINTAHRLAAATWNGDQVGADFFREALVRWSARLDLDRHQSFDIERPHLLLPDVMRMTWPEARDRVVALSYDRAPSPSPETVFSLVASVAHGDVLYLTEALLTLWTIAGKQTSGIACRTARDLLLRKGRDDAAHGHEDPDQGLRSRLAAHLRMHLAGERFDEGGYAEDLDRLVRRLDGMTERQVVPGRVFTPSTSFGREDLLPAATAILAASVHGADGRAVTLLADLASRVDLLRDGDATLRDILEELKGLGTACSPATEPMHEAIRIMRTGADAEIALKSLRETLDAGAAAIAAERTRRLHAMSVDDGRLGVMAAEIEAALLAGSAEIPFFLDADVVREDGNDAVSTYTLPFEGVTKAGLVIPPMESSSRDLNAFLAARVADHAGWLAWRAFTARPHRDIRIPEAIESVAFWRAIAALIDSVGPDPILVVSRQAEARALRRMLRLRAGEEPGLKVEHLGKPGDYVGTFNGIDVHAGDLKQGLAWLFSSRCLKAVRYSRPANSPALVSVTYEPVSEEVGKLLISFAQHREWADTTAYELTVLDPEEDES